MRLKLIIYTIKSNIKREILLTKANIYQQNFFYSLRTSFHLIIYFNISPIA
jgi:hypothetical protein